MLKNPFPGKFIVFEGLDGSGQSTQADLLFKYFKKEGKKVYQTAEPTTFLIGGLIKSQLAGEWKSSPECLQLLFTADRAYQLEKEIVPLLEKGINVICTRYILSTLAFGSIEIEDRDWLWQINDKFIFPDIILLLKVPAKICMERIKKERFHEELFEKEDKLEKVMKNYLDFSGKFENLHLIDGEKPIEEVFEEFKKNINI